MSLPVRPVVASSLLVIFTACAGPPVPTPLDDEEVCADYLGKGNEKMLGGLRVPVVLTILDGKNPVFHATLQGLKGAGAPKTQITVPDASAEYTVEWAQCAAKRPERRLADGPDAAWKCGEAKVYKTDKLVTKKGDLASHALRYALPPDATCWIGEMQAPDPSAHHVVPPAPPPPVPPDPGGAVAPDGKK